MITVNKSFIEQFDPCADRWENYLQHYLDFEGTLLDFMKLEYISDTDKIWLFSRPIKGIERLQRKFAVMCADIPDAKKEVRGFFLLIKNLYKIVDHESIEHLKDDTYRAADRAAYLAAEASWGTDRAAYWAADVAAEASWGTDRAAYWAADVAYKAADRAAYLAADMAAEWEAERKKQTQNIINLLENEK